MVIDSLPVTPAPGARGRTEQRSLSGVPAAVPQARRFVREVLALWGRPDLEEAGMLLASELVSNAVLHARSDLDVALTEVDADVVLAVSDSSASLPAVRRHTRDAATGRGLWLLHQYSVRHGVDVTRPGTGKQVWAVLRPEGPTADEGPDAALAMWLDRVEGL